MKTRQWMGVTAGWWLCATLFAATAAQAAGTENRFPPLTVDQMTDEQKAAMGENYDPNGFQSIYLRSPGMLAALQKFSHHAMNETPTPPGLIQMAALITGRYWDFQSPWVFHVQLAQKAGISQAAINSIAQKKRLPGMSPPEAALYDLGTEIFTQHAVSDATFKTAREVLGDRAILDLIGTMGNYTIQAMVLGATARQVQPPPKGFPSYDQVPYPPARAN